MSQAAHPHVTKDGSVFNVSLCRGEIGLEYAIFTIPKRQGKGDNIFFFTLNSFNTYTKQKKVNSIGLFKPLKLYDNCVLFNNYQYDYLIYITCIVSVLFKFNCDKL